MTDGVDILRLGFKECVWDFKINPKTKHYYGGYHLFYDLKKRWLEFKVSEVMLGTVAKYEDTIKYLMDFHDNGPFTLKIQRADIPSDDFLEVDGTNESYQVAIKKDGIRDVHKISKGHQDVYQIGLLLLEQAG
jgi:hypothetical protein